MSVPFQTGDKLVLRGLRREEDNKPALDWVLAPDAPTDDWRQIRTRYGQAIVDATIDLGLHTQLNRHSYDESVADAAVSAVAESLSIRK